jgi:16S rRNA (adenine(1408)-N(1))-methyltransferase
VAGIERPPVELACQADELTILFPWGSLLRGALALDDAAAAGITSLLRPGGRAISFVSIAERDGLDLPPLDEDGHGLAERWLRHGLELHAFTPASSGQAAATGSSWARRLAADRVRPIWRFELTRPAAATDEFRRAR